MAPVSGRPNRSDKPERLVARHIEFLGEQDGLPERELKATLASVFVRWEAVQRAYLALVRYETTGPHHVALCIASSEPDDRTLVDCVLDLFEGRFGPHEHLDVLFLRGGQEAELGRACRAFYAVQPNHGL